MPNHVPDMRGQVFGRLTVVNFRGISGRKAYWCCRCICGSTVKVRACHLRSGNTVSCGCARKDVEIRRCARQKVPAQRRKEIASMGRAAKGVGKRTVYSVPSAIVAETLMIPAAEAIRLMSSGALDARLRKGKWYTSRAELVAYARLIGAKSKPKVDC